MIWHESTICLCLLQGDLDDFLTMGDIRFCPLYPLRGMIRLKPHLPWELVGHLCCDKSSVETGNEPIPTKLTSLFAAENFDSVPWVSNIRRKKCVWKQENLLSFNIHAIQICFVKHFVWFVFRFGRNCSICIANALEIQQSLIRIF